MGVGFGLSAAVLVAAFVFGGGASLASPGDLVPQLLSLPLLYHALGPGWARLSGAPLIRFWMIGVLVLFGLQLLPLPPALWGAVPGHEPIRAMVGAAGDPGWMSLSLRPQQTVKSFLALLPSVALFFGVVTLDLKRRIWLLALLIGLVLLSISVGLLQLVNGPSSPLYFYQFTTTGRAVGFFANPNHFVAPLYATLPLLAALMTGRSGRNPGLMAAVFAGIAFTYLIGLSTSGSRTALLLGGASLAFALVGLARRGIVARLAVGRPLIAVGALLGVLMTPVLLGVGLISILERLDTQDVVDDLRWSILPAAVRQGLSYLPFGAGLGTFDRVYALQEGVATLMPAYVNHVHNDWVEVFFEAGVPGLVLMGLGLLIVGKMTLEALVSPPDLAGRLLAGGVLCIWLLLAHSVWDYPLRTQACVCVLALALALGVPAVETNVSTLEQAWPWVERRRRKSGGRRRSASGEAGSAEDAAAV